MASTSQVQVLFRPGRVAPLNDLEKCVYDLYCRRMEELVGDLTDMEWYQGLAEARQLSITRTTGVLSRHNVAVRLENLFKAGRGLCRARAELVLIIFGASECSKKEWFETYVDINTKVIEPGFAGVIPQVQNWRLVAGGFDPLPPISEDPVEFVSKRPSSWRPQPTPSMESIANEAAIDNFIPQTASGSASSTSTDNEMAQMNERITSLELWQQRAQNAQATVWGFDSNIEGATSRTPDVDPTDTTAHETC